MRIVSRAALFAMPPGTLFHEYEPQSFGPIEVFEGVTGRADDYVSEPASDPSFEGVGSSNELSDLLHDAEVDGRSMPLIYGDNSCRDGCFDAMQKYAVYEKQDVERLIAYLSEQLNRAY